MSVDRAGLARAIAAHGPVVRVVVARAQGSAPREAGAAMLVWPGGTDGTIGGGALEFEATRRARAMTGERAVLKRALGPDLGQCCGGAVTLLLERWEAPPPAGPLARPLDGPGPTCAAHGPDAAMPLSVRRLVRDWRAGAAARPALIDGWFVEPETVPAHALWLHGAGHVGRALVEVMAPLPDWSITWVDTGRDRFPDDVPVRVTRLPAADPALAAAHAPANARHLIMTHSHELDLRLCDAILHRGFAGAGLIGSATKRARFRKRLRQLGHPDAQIARIACPIGDPGLGKHPRAIAIGVAQRLLNEQATAKAARGEGDEGAAHG